MQLSSHRHRKYLERTLEMTTTTTRELIHVDHAIAKRLGNWTTANAFKVQARKGSVVLDLRAPGIIGDVTIDLDLQRTVLTLLVPEDVTVDSRDLRFTGRGRVKDDQAAALDGPSPRRVIHLAGAAADGQIRVRRAGVAQLTAMLSRAYLNDLRHAHRTNTLPTVDDPAR
jgi:hypothetical protein